MCVARAPCSCNQNQLFVVVVAVAGSAATRKRVFLPVTGCFCSF